MKCSILAVLLVASLALVLGDSNAVYAPEYNVYETPEFTQAPAVGGRSKRHVSPGSLAFLIGVGAGGIFGPLLYNRLYGNRVAYSEPIYTQGWEAPVVNQGWGASSGGY